MTDQIAPEAAGSKNTQPYPLLLKPDFHERVWGGRRLADVIQATLPDGPIGESWSMGTDSQVLNGPLSGKKLGEVVAADPERMLGKTAMLDGRSDLPLLFKILDAQDLLSIQVHPNDEQARSMENVPFGKTEAWYVLDAAPGAYVIHSFTRPVTPEEARQGLGDGSIVEVLRKVELHEGDSILVPAGTVHAIGGGLLLGEIQENSDITYRLYDWGRPREMHLEKGLKVMNMGEANVPVSEPLDVEHESSAVRYLVACRHFAYRRLTVGLGMELDTAGRSFSCLFCLSGSGRIHTGAGDQGVEFAQGQTVFVPASVGRYTIEAEGCQLLQAFVPDLKLDIIEPLLNAGYSKDQIGALGGGPGNTLEQMLETTR